MFYLRLTTKYSQCTVNENKGFYYLVKSTSQSMERQNCLMVLGFIILGAYSIILGAYVLICGAFFIIFGAYSIHTYIHT